MTLAALFAKTWLAANLFLQTGSVPIWVPLTIVLLIILLFWWGLTRNRIPEESETAAGHDEEAEMVEEPPAAAEAAVEAAGVDEEAAGDEIADDEPAPPTEVDRAPAVIEEPESAPEPDDLKVIEGIGPKISGILADAGITTFAQLAKTDPEQLNKIVREDAGIKVANPTSWPEQASLAAAGDWDELEELQNRLVAGRHRS